MKRLSYEFLTKKFFPNLGLLNLGCSLSVSAAYTPVFTGTSTNLHANWVLTNCEPASHASHARQILVPSLIIIIIIIIIITVSLNAQAKYSKDAA